MRSPGLPWMTDVKRAGRILASCAGRAPLPLGPDRGRRASRRLRLRRL